MIDPTPTINVFTFHSDPGHGWLEVPAALVRSSSATITHYSYHDPDTDTAYLEEDQDAQAFLNTQEHGTYKIKQKRTNEDSFVRDLDSYYSD